MPTAGKGYPVDRDNTFPPFWSPIPICTSDVPGDNGTADPTPDTVAQPLLSNNQNAHFIVRPALKGLNRPFANHLPRILGAGYLEGRM